MRRSWCVKIVVVTLLLLCLSGCSTSESGSAPASPASASNLDDINVDLDRYRRDVAFIASAPRVGPSAHHTAVQNLCADRFEALGFLVERHDYGTGVNVIGTLPGKTAPGEIVMVSAHYDSVAKCNGTDDNASGVAAVLETARVLASREHDRSLVVACWDEEESGLVGSSRYAERERDKGSEIITSYVFDMIGYRNNKPDSQQLPAGYDAVYPELVQVAKRLRLRGNFIAVVYDAPARRMDCKKTKVPSVFVWLWSTYAEGSTFEQNRAKMGPLWRLEQE